MFWATGFHRVVDSHHVAANELEKLHLQFLSRWCGLRKHVPGWILYEELGQLPLVHVLKLVIGTWWRGVFSCWNQMSGAENADVWK